MKEKNSLSVNKERLTAKDRDKVMPEFINDLDPDYLMKHFAGNNE